MSKRERNEEKDSESDSSKKDLIGAMLGAKVIFSTLIVIRKRMLRTSNT